MRVRISALPSTLLACFVAVVTIGGWRGSAASICGRSVGPSFWLVVTQGLVLFVPIRVDDDGINLDDGTALYFVLGVCKLFYTKYRKYVINRICGPKPRAENCVLCCQACVLRCTEIRLSSRATLFAKLFAKEIVWSPLVAAACGRRASGVARGCDTRENRCVVERWI